MNKLLCCVILAICGASVRAKLTDEILNNEEESTDYYYALLFEYATNHFAEYHKNLVVSQNGCFICGKVLSVLMNASVQSFLTVNDIAATNYSAVESPIEVVPDIRYYELVVFLMENVDEFFKHFAKLRLMYAWNPRARHLIFIVKKLDEEELEVIFKECWSRKVLNVAVIIWNQKEAYTYNPYLKNHSGMCEKMENWSRLFYDKLRNMNGYVIRTKYVPFSSNDVPKWIPEEGRYKFFGADYGYANAFFQTVNATPEFINLTTDMVPYYRNFSYRHKLWKDLKFHDAELWTNFMSLQSKFYERNERVYPLRRDDIRILTPKSGLKTPSIFDPYNNATWTCVMLSIMIFALYSCVLYKLRGINDNAFLRTFGIFLGKNLAIRRHGRLEKFTFFVFTMYSMLILSAYQGALYGALATVSYVPEINTMAELYKRTKTIHCFHITSGMISAFLQPGMNVIPFDTNAYVEFMKTHRYDAYAFSNTIAQYIVKLKIHSENGVPLFHIMNGYSIPAFVSHTVPYGSPYLKKLERVFLACKEAGMDQHWDAEANLFAVLSGTVLSDLSEKKSLKKLSLQAQLIGFYIWGAGLLISSSCFTIEFIICRYAMKMLTKIVF